MEQPSPVHVSAEKLVDNPSLLVRFLFDYANKLNPDFGDGVVDNVTMRHVMAGTENDFTFAAIRERDEEGEESTVIYVLSETEVDHEPILPDDVEEAVETIVDNLMDENDDFDPDEFPGPKLNMVRSVIINSQNQRTIFTEDPHYEYFDKRIDRDIAHNRSIYRIPPSEMAIDWGDVQLDDEEVREVFAQIVIDAEVEHRRQLQLRLLGKMAGQKSQENS